MAEYRARAVHYSSVLALPSLGTVDQYRLVRVQPLQEEVVQSCFQLEVEQAVSVDLCMYLLAEVELTQVVCLALLVVKVPEQAVD